MTLGDRIAVMKDGVVQQYASPKETYDHPANQFVAGFIGSPSMNFLPARVTKGASVRCLRELDFRLNFHSNVPRTTSQRGSWLAYARKIWMALLLTRRTRSG
jgi:ABC-type sugar transport system ATPase subunit